MSALVEMSNIDKSFPGVRALARARFDLQPGEVHALMGENGAGKSTLMKILAGVYTRDAGEIRLDGQPVEIATPRAAQDAGHQHHPSGTQPDAASDGGAEHLHRPRAAQRSAACCSTSRSSTRDAADIFASMNLRLDPRARGRRR